MLPPQLQKTMSEMLALLHKLDTRNSVAYWQGVLIGVRDKLRDLSTTMDTEGDGIELTKVVSAIEDVLG